MNDKAKYAIRIVLGGYLAFLGIRLFKMAVIDGAGNTALGMFLGPIFLIVGGAYLINSVKKVLAIRKAEIYGVPDEEAKDTEETELIEETADPAAEDAVTEEAVKEETAEDK